MVRTSVSRVQMEFLEDRYAPGSVLDLLSPLALWGAGLPRMDWDSLTAPTSQQPALAAPPQPLAAIPRLSQDRADARATPTPVQAADVATLGVAPVADAHADLALALGSLLADDPGSVASVLAPYVRPGFDVFTLPSCDDCSYPAGAAPLGFSLTLGAVTTSSVRVNNNGNLTVWADYPGYTPAPLASLGFPMISPFWSDVLTGHYGLVGWYHQYIEVVYQDVPYTFWAFGATWDDVPGYGLPLGLRNTFQVVLIDSAATLGINLMEFNYDKIEWDLGTASGGNCARIGYTDGGATSWEPAGISGVCGAFLGVAGRVTLPVF